MAKSTRLVKDDRELQEKEAIGLWKAQALAKNIGGGTEKITLEVILRIHKVFQEEANPNIAGKFRVNGQEINELDCIAPPPGRVVNEQMYSFWRDFDVRLSKIPLAPKTKSKTARKKRNEAVIDLAAWTQYQITRIHPFCEGNGRMARLMTNLVLYRHKLLPTDIKYEGEDKKGYLHALCEIDKRGDYRMLVHLIIKGMTGSYRKLIKAKENAKK